MEMIQSKSTVRKEAIMEREKESERERERRREEGSKRKR